MTDPIARRKFFQIGGGLATGAAGLLATANEAAALKQETKGGPGATVLPYGRKLVVRSKELRVAVPHAFTFPDEASPCVVIKNGKQVPGGVGPDRDIAAFSTMCPHMGCITAYDAKERVFRCPCHFSCFDAEMAGQMICGQATVDLPEIVLEYDEKSDGVIAMAVRGLLYGRSANIF